MRMTWSIKWDNGALFKIEGVSALNQRGRLPFIESIVY
jgi:hypothetical protein